MIFEVKKKIFQTSICLFMLSFIPSAIATKYSNDGYMLFAAFIGETIGGAISLFLIFLVISLVISPFYWLLSQKRMTGFHWVMCVIFVIVSFFAIMGAQKENINNPPKESGRITLSQESINKLKKFDKKPSKKNNSQTRTLSKETIAKLEKFCITPPKKNNQTIAPVFAASTEQSSEGVIEGDMNQKFLKYFETWMVKTCKKKAMLAYAELGHDPSNFHPEFTSKSQYVYIEKKKLAVISVSSHGGNKDKTIRAVKIIGFSAPETLSTVACIRQSNHDIPIYTGVCGAKIKEVFGVGIPMQ